MSTILITGGAGFLGSQCVRAALNRGYERVINIDKLTYAGDPSRLNDCESDPRYVFLQSDIVSAEDMSSIFADYKPNHVLHCAAESHVTRSEDAPDLFYRTNVEGTRNLLEAAVATGVAKFVHVSTDEVYGPILRGSFREEDKPEGEGKATSPYARSKAVADDQARSFADKLPVVVVRPTNAFGPYQFPEKAFARWVTRGLRGEPLLVWGDGKYVRQWLYAEDFAEGLLLLCDRGEGGEVFNLGPEHRPEITNIDLARWLADRLSLGPDAVVFTEYDRPDHDRRYAVDPARIRGLGWTPGEVWDQFESTVVWFENNRPWWERHVQEAESIYSDTSSR